MLFKFSQLVKQPEIYDAQLLSKICPLQLKHKYLILEQKIKQAKELEHEIYKMKDEDQEFTPQNTLNSKFIIIRHALAWHNYFKRVTEFKDSNIYHYDLIDPPLQYLGTKQCDKLKLEINKLEFDKVYVSPLLRAIQTTQLLFCNHPQKEKIQFILCPDICEKISTINSVYKWGTLTQLLKDNGNPIQFDFSQMPDNLEFWQFNLLQKVTTQEIAKQIRKISKDSQLMSLSEKDQAFNQNTAGVQSVECKDLQTKQKKIKLKVKLVS